LKTLSAIRNYTGKELAKFTNENQPIVRHFSSNGFHDPVNTVKVLVLNQVTVAVLNCSLGLYAK